MSETTYTGGCFCGNVRYRFEGGDIPCADCHCTMCRRISGAPYVTWLVVAEDKFQYTGEAPTLLKSSEKGSRYFCEKCGTPVVCVTTDHPGIVDITLGSLDTPEAFTPTISIFDETRLPHLHSGE